MSRCLQGDQGLEWKTDGFCPPEPATKHRYNKETSSWTSEEVTVQLRINRPIAEGTNRLVYLMLEVSNPTQQQYVAKSIKQLTTGRKEYFNDAIMQAKCALLAAEYNKRGPPKMIHFLESTVIELKSRPHDATGGCPLFMVESFLSGLYKKHSNNYGYVDYHSDRNTPQAFSHFSYHISNGLLIVVDIQGVNDTYTDPQLHSSLPPNAPPVYGEGDLGALGISKFFETHRCNALCDFLGLNKKTFKANDHGTRAQGGLGAVGAFGGKPSGIAGGFRSQSPLSSNQFVPSLSTIPVASPSLPTSLPTSFPASPAIMNNFSSPPISVAAFPTAQPIQHGYHFNTTSPFQQSHLMGQPMMGQPQLLGPPVQQPLYLPQHRLF